MKKISTKRVWMRSLGSEIYCSAECLSTLRLAYQACVAWSKTLLLVKTGLSYRRQALLKKTEVTTAMYSLRTALREGSGSMSI